MFVRKWAAGLLGVVGLLAGAVTAQAGDTIRLALPAREDAAALKLGQIDPQADILDVGFRGGFAGGFRGGFAGGFRGGFAGGFRGGFAGGFRGGFAGGFRGFAGGFRGGFAGGFRGGFAGGFRGGFAGGFRGFSGGYYGFAAFPPTYIYGYSSCPQFYSYSYCPISTPVVSTSTFSLSIVPPTPPSVLQVLPSDEATAPGVLPSPYPAGKDGTFDYDGGPAAPVPVPRVDPAPRQSPPSVPLEGRPVSLPARVAPKYTYPAYGELPR